MGVCRDPRLCEQVALGLAGHIGLDDDIVDIGTDGDAHIGREGPRSGGPDQGECTGIRPGLESVADGDRRVLADLVNLVIHPQLVVGQRRLVVPAVGQDAEAFVDQALVIERLEGPEDRLHEGRVQRLVVIVEVDPARLAGDIVAPLGGVFHDRLAALGVEGLDADLEDLVLGLDPELAHRLELGGQAVGVPAEAALDALAAHGLVARDDILDVAGQQVAVVRQAVGEGRAVIEDELVVAILAGRAIVDGCLEGAVGVPILQHGLLDRGEARAGRDGCAAGAACLRIGHRYAVLRARPAPRESRVSSSTRGRHRPGFGPPPRYHLACRMAPAQVSARHTTARAGYDGPLPSGSNERSPAVLPEARR